MKKSFLVTRALAVASIPSFAVTTNCLSGSVALSSLAAGSGNSCTLTNGANTWTLTEFRAYATPYFSRGQGWTYRPRERHVVIAALPCRCVAWFDELLDSKSYGTSRGTGVMVLRDGVWKVSQYALTFPIPNDLAKHMTDEIKRFEAGEKVH